MRRLTPIHTLAAFVGLVLGLVSGAVVADVASPRQQVTVAHPTVVATLEVLTPTAEGTLPFPGDPDTMMHDELVVATVEAWALAHVPATVDGNYLSSGHLARCLAESATWEHHRTTAPRCTEAQRADAYRVTFGTYGGMAVQIQPGTAHSAD